MSVQQRGYKALAPAVIDVPLSAIRWPVSGDNTEPKVAIGGDRWRWAHQVKIDPVPSYPHDIELVRQCFDEAWATFPIPFAPAVYVLPYDVPARFNATTMIDVDYSEKAPKSPHGMNLPHPFSCAIVLAGKRVPPHPALTRYLVAHEYGHVVEHWFQYCEGLEADREDFEAGYAKLRGLTMLNDYASDNWHMTPGEVFACDFRLMVMEVEPEYWPHPGVPRPEGVSGLREWWNRALMHRRPPRDDYWATY